MADESMLKGVECSAQPCRPSPRCVRARLDGLWPGGSGTGAEAVLTQALGGPTRPGGRRRGALYVVARERLRRAEEEGQRRKGLV